MCNEFSEQEYTILKSMARNGNSKLRTTYEGSFEGDEFDETTFDKEFFIENARDLIKEQNC